MRGGAIVSPDKETKVKIDHLKNFGFVGETNVVAPGINGKMNECSAAMGLLQLKYIDQAIEQRKKIDAAYRERLNEVKGIQCLGNSGEVVANYSYFPILIDDSFPITRDELYERLKSNNIHPRRYFYPLISSFSMYKDLPSANSDKLPVATISAQQILCLPIYPDLELKQVDQICDLMVAV